MRKLLPHPVLSLALFVIWLLLNNTVHPAHLLLGAALAIGIPFMMPQPGLFPVRIKQPLTIIVLTLIVFYDIVKSNITVALLILGPERNITPAFVWVPLDVTDPTAKTALAGIITMTPGTLSSDFSDDGKFLLVHSLNVTDQDALIAEIKERYEAPLKEIFE
jgi:multicomponent K+:H+ antiporter subunit E